MIELLRSSRAIVVVLALAWLAWVPADDRRVDAAGAIVLAYVAGRTWRGSRTDRPSSS